MPDQAFTLPSFAKINWYLRIIGKRNDGFHELYTVFQTVSLFDELHFSECDDLTLTCSNPKVPTDERNLIILAASQLKERFKVKSGARIHLEKRIPAPGGLGGGSSNSAVALLGLARLWNLKPQLEDLKMMAAALGSDVPFFFHGGTTLGTARGNEIEPVANIVENFMLIATPNIDVSTSEAFAHLDAPYLTNSDSKSILQICRFEAFALKLRQSVLINDFEKAVFRIEPEIERVKKKLFDLGAIRALMSGSGASVFSVFDSKEELEFASDALKAEDTWQIYHVKTVSREEYLKSLNLVESLLR